MSNSKPTLVAMVFLVTACSKQEGINYEALNEKGETIPQEPDLTSDPNPEPDPEPDPQPEDWSPPEDDCEDCFRPQSFYLKFYAAYDLERDSACGTFYSRYGDETNTGIEFVFVGDSLDEFGEPETCRMYVAWESGGCVPNLEMEDSPFPFVAKIPLTRVLIDTCSGTLNEEIWGDMGSNILASDWYIGFGGEVASGLPSERDGLSLINVGFMYPDELNEGLYEKQAAGYALRMDDSLQVEEGSAAEIRLSPDETDPPSTSAQVLMQWGEGYGSDEDLFLSSGMLLPHNVGLE